MREGEGRQAGGDGQARRKEERVTSECGRRMVWVWFGGRAWASGSWQPEMAPGG